MMIGFLLILTTSTLNLVLQEMQDGKGRQDYLKAFAWAEGSLELALLKIKEHWYGYDEDNFSWAILWWWPKDPQIGYNFESEVSSYSGQLAPFETAIFPLFFINAWWTVNPTSWLELTTSSNLTWNIIWNGAGVSWVWGFSSSDNVGVKSVSSFDDSGNISLFLASNSWSFLSLYNTSATETMVFELLWSWANPSFTKAEAEIYSQARVWKYVQNLETSIDNTEFLWILKYSIYSWN